MDYRLMTPNLALREHEARLRDANRAWQAAEAYRRMRIRSNLRKAILETVRLDGSVQDLATEFAELVRRTEQRLSGRPCC